LGKGTVDAPGYGVAQWNAAATAQVMKFDDIYAFVRAIVTFRDWTVM
jgi:hypothetical protein